jgi:hypothetical protein
VKEGDEPAYPDLGSIPKCSTEKFILVENELVRKKIRKELLLLKTFTNLNYQSNDNRRS